MKRIYFILIISFLVFTYGMKAYAQSSKDEYIIVLDAGHGGKDPGAVGKLSYEKDINLAIVLKLGAYLEKNLKNVKVLYTRKSDVFIPLHKRSKLANAHQADLFISVHCNSNNSSKVYGSETYVMGLHKSEANLKVAQLENASILKEDNYAEYYEGFDPGSPEAYIIFSLYQNANLEHSLDIASKVQTQFRERAGMRDRGVLQAGFLVLYRATMPGILVETGYISNANDEKFLKSEKGQSYVASAIYRAVRDYLKNQEQEKISLNVIENEAESLEEEIIFRVQFLSSKKVIKLNSRKFKGLNKLYEYQHQGVHRYCTGESDKFEKMNKLKAKLNRGKYKDAFVVAFKNGERISISKARKLTEN